MRYLLLLLILSLSAPACADIYKWVDSKGVVNFTDNRESVPAKYRKKASVISTEKTGPAVSTPVDEGSVSGTVPGSAAAKGDKLYGGHDEAWWRDRYGSLRAEIKDLQDNLPRKRQELEQLNRKYKLFTYSRNRVAYQEKAAEVKGDEDRIKELQEKLNDLENEAGRAGIPFEWRK